MKILLISHAFPPDMGAASSRTWNLAKSLTRRGNDVTVIAGRPYYPKGIVPPLYWRKFLIREFHIGRAIEVLRVWLPALPTEGLWRRLAIYLGFELSYTLALLLLLSRRRFDLVYYISPYALSFFSFPALTFGKLHGSKVLLDVHDLWPEVILQVGNIRSKTAERLLSWMTKVSIMLSDHVVSSDWGIGSRLPVPTDKAKVIELAVDTEMFHRWGDGGVKEEFGGRLLVEYSGVLARRYDFDVILGAARMLKDDPRIVFLIRGDGEMTDYVLRESKDLQNVIIRPEVLPFTEVIDYLNAADVLLCPLRPSLETETSVPTKVVEYMAVGRPIVCTGKGRIAELIWSSNSGVVIPPGDPFMLCATILMLAEDKELRTNLGLNAKNTAEERFSLDRLGEQVEELVR